jgi:hypothetical protein
VVPALLLQIFDQPKKLARGKRFSLFCCSISDEEEKVDSIALCVNVTNYTADSTTK